MYDPLGPNANPFASSASTTAPWPTTPHSPFDPAILPKPSSPKPSTPEKSLANTNPYGREPQIYGQPVPGLVSPNNNAVANGTKFERSAPYLRVRITGLDRNRRDILVRFDAQTNLPNFTGTTYRNVSRSYVEFQRFAEQIVYSNPQTIVPALPLAQTSAPTDDEDDRLIKVMLQRWFSRICEDPVLLQDEEVRSFIESDFGYQPTVRAKRKTSSGFSLLKRGAPDEDEELVAARFELTRLEGEFFEAAKAIDRLSRARKALSTAHTEMGNRLVNVATTEGHPPLGNALRKLGRTWHNVGDIDSAQAVSETVILGDALGYQGINARSAKETLQQRSLVLEEYQTAVKASIAKRRNIERLKASSNIRPDRVDEALEDMEEANKIEQILAKRVDGISQNLHKALLTHSRHAHEDITHALVEHARTTVLYEKQMLRELESLRPDFANINKAGLIKETVTPSNTTTSIASGFPNSPPNRTMSDAAIGHRASLSSEGVASPGRMDGTKSMFISPSPANTRLPPSHTNSPSVIPNSPLPASAVNPRMVESASSSSAPASPRDPLGAHGGPFGAGIPPSPRRFDAGIHGRPGLHPTGANTMARSMYIEPTRSRLDAREAAAKLANFL